MAEKLKSILKRIHWSLPRKSIWGLILKAAIFAVAWLILPWWLFFLVALYCYFIPLFRSGKLLVPFFCLLVLTIAQSPGFLFALVFGIIFYYILLIKDLLIINRKSAYELLVLASSFFLIWDLFSGHDGLSGSAFFWAFWCAIAIGLLVHNMMRFFADDASLPVISPSIVPDDGVSRLAKASGMARVDGDSESKTSLHRFGAPEEGSDKSHLRLISSWLIIMLSWQCILVGLFLPLNFIYQSIIVFVAITFFCELIIGYFWNDLSRERIFVTASTFFALLVILLASAPWKI